ncbi:MAG: thiamine phosphate synthase [Rhodospirillaceae bacterium]|nr:thiamine phosphate synthase [Rhodospirillaceae bacterium]
MRRALTARLRGLCRAHRVALLVAGDWRAAVVFNCDGVHLPEVTLNHVTPGLRLWRRSKGIIVTAAAHSARALRCARAQHIDAVLLSPVLPTASHPDRLALGRVRYAMMARTARVPVVALGGITRTTVRALNGTRTSGVAGIGFALS